MSKVSKFRTKIKWQIHDYRPELIENSFVVFAMPCSWEGKGKPPQLSCRFIEAVSISPFSDFGKVLNKKMNSFYC